LVTSKGFGRSAAPSRRGPKGRRHAVDPDTGDAACGTLDALRVFEDWPWAPEGDWCEECAAAAPFE
jgi:hypothetical protein